MNAKGWTDYFNLLMGQVRKDIADVTTKHEQETPNVKSIKDALYNMVAQEESDQVLNRHAEWMGMVKMPLGTETIIPKRKGK